MKLLIRSVTFECLGDMLAFDVTAIADEEEKRLEFIFKPAHELVSKYGMVETGFRVETDMKKKIKQLQIILPNVQLAKELSDCLRNFIAEFELNDLL